MPSGVAIAASIIHPSFTVLTIVGNSPEGPDKECEYLLHNSVGGKAEGFLRRPLFRAASS
ncbi:protein of unknown function [Enterobacter cancerogenus]|nr:protein of unknown function [Enterobacter cancerogenus]